MVEAADHLEVLVTGEVLVDRRVLTGEADLRAQGAGVLDDVEARRRAALPLSGGSSVVRMRTAVVLPAPLGPSSPSTVPARHVEIDPLQSLRRS